MPPRSPLRRLRPWLIGVVRDRRVRRAGAAVGRALFGAPELPAPLLDPLEAVRSSRLPLIGSLGRAVHGRVSASRRRRIDDAGDPLVSVVMAARDAEPTIAPAIDSVLAQSHWRVELLVVDDASDDRTASLVEAYAARDDRVRLIRRSEAGGAAAARNAGLAAAVGRYATFQDADDRSHPDRIARQLALLIKDPEARLAMCRYRRVGSDGRTVVVNERAYRKCIVAMMFPRAPVLDAVGFLRADLPVGEDAEYYERIKAVFGEACERRLSAPLYEAAFDPSSLLFSAGAVEPLRGGEIRYTQAAEHVASQAAWRAQHRLIATGERSPRVGPDGRAALEDVGD